MSAFVLSFMFFKKYDYVDKKPLMKDSEFLSFATIKRYPRLVIPIFLTSFVMWVFYRLNFVYSDEVVPISNSTDWLSDAFPLNNKYPNFLHLIRVSFVDLFMKGDISYNNVLWTIKYEFFGSLLVFAILALFGRSVFRYLVYFILVLKFGNTEYMAFIIGIFLADMFYSNEFKSFRSFFSKPFVSTTLFLFGMYMGSYSKGINSKYYSWMNILGGGAGDNYKWIYTTGATFIVLSLLYNKWLQKIFSVPWLLFCGRISYAMYLLHSILIGTVASYVMYVLHSDNYSYGISVGLTFFIFMVLLFAGSFYFTKYVDERQVSKTKEILKRFS